ncbi:serine hydrolase domain-containing protein [Autumnicola edwardsiae]|jgi:CubicO group peptidase (beta-lactamase class C family)|uniref:Serine hydrolase n=1 Tax=Autumnicola edwardsiae TaxID=3075594 RepID=A0ABU3CUV4_9FLAO|nr:serine hydrolase [Zunongwangia sp. F297]MDT0650066.1 serine hydrolase [Zunongwangia sp. F297]
MRKTFRYFGYFFCCLLLAAALIYFLGYGYIFRAIGITYLQGHTTAYIDDYTEFQNRRIAVSENIQEWPGHDDYNIVNPTEDLRDLNEELGTAAFLIIKNDSIWFEEYYNGYSKDSRTNSFSMAKSIVSALLGRAIKDGHIESLEQPVADYFPQFDKALKVGDLASMASGLNWNENYYNPFGMTAEAYFGKDIRELVLDLEVTEEPGDEFKYLSGNTILLAMLIEKATNTTLSEYLSESFWKPLGMQKYALWQLDSRESGMEKAYCCIASNARDFAKIGKLYKDHGKWNGQQILDSSYVAQSINPRFDESPQYGYGFWLSTYQNKNFFYMRGILGQYVIVIPEDNLIIIRLGRKLIKKEDDQEHSPDLFIYIEEACKMLEAD